MSLRKSFRHRKEKVQFQRGYTIDDIVLDVSQGTGIKDKSLSRRNSSMSLTSQSSGSDDNNSPKMPRRGRRLAIIDTKNVGDAAPLSSDVTPNNSCDEVESERAARLSSRRRSSIDLETKTYQRDQILRDKRKRLIKRNTIADFYRSRDSPQNNASDDKKSRPVTFSFKRLIKTRSKEELSKMGELLSKLQPSQFQDTDLTVYKNCHWSDLIACSDKDSKPIQVPELERKRREAVWELFTSECVFLTDHLMVLKHCFFEPLKKLQVEGFLMYVEPQEIFSNLDELCYISYTFCKDLLSVLLKQMANQTVWSTQSLVEVLDRFSSLSDEGDVYHTYCITYSKCLSNLERLKKNDDYSEFEKWCEQDSRCNRLQLSDLLVSPLQHCTKLPLLLSNIRKYSEHDSDKKLLEASIGKVEKSLRELEEKMKRDKNIQRIQEIQQQLVWPSILDLDPKAYIPEFLKSSLSIQPCTKLLSCPRRQLLHEGPLMLAEATKSVDVHLLLFDDILLITKIKKSVKKKQTSGESSSVQDQPAYIVHRQPIALDRLSLHDVGAAEASANGLKNCLVLVHISRFQQIIGVYTLQSANESIKEYWISKLMDAKKKFGALTPEANSTVNGLVDYTQHNSNTLRRELSPRRARRARMLSVHKKKSLSMDTVFIT